MPVSFQAADNAGAHRSHVVEIKKVSPGFRNFVVSEWLDPGKPPRPSRDVTPQYLLSKVWLLQSGFEAFYVCGKNPRPWRSDGVKSWVWRQSWPGSGWELPEVQGRN